ncbi:MAG: hypothetical protein ACLU0O_09465 [Collinsella sp.]
MAMTQHYTLGIDKGASSVAMVALDGRGRGGGRGCGERAGRALEHAASALR